MTTDLQPGFSSSSRRYRVRHETTYDYTKPVSVSYGRAHLLPRSIPSQQVVNSNVVVTPVADEIRNHNDFFGNSSTFYVVRRPHRQLAVVATSEVSVTRPSVIAADLDGVTWEAASVAAAGNLDASGYRLWSPLIGASTLLRDYASPSFSIGRPMGETVAELSRRIHADFAYKSGATTVSTTLEQLLGRREGVCQDFAHLMVGCLRSAGLAARYVSGYLETEPPPGEPKMLGVDASHAWASVYLPDLGWVDIDPTNNKFVDARYVVVGWGRDYADVPPLKGVMILASAVGSTMKVSVDVTRVDQSLSG